MDYDFQRASMLKRIPAWILDMIMLITLATGLMACISYVVDIDTSIEKMNAVYTRYEQEYGVSFEMTEEESQKMTEEELAKYQSAMEALAKDTQTQKLFELLMNQTLLIAGFGFLGAFLILEILIPLWLKNGQTLGKKCFGIALMRKDGIKVTPFMLFVRAILGKYTVETMIPILVLLMWFFGIMGLGLLLALGFLLVQIIVPMATRNKTAIHDLAACTVAVDLASQMIFDSVEDMEAYNAQIHVERAFEEQE